VKNILFFRNKMKKDHDISLFIVIVKGQGLLDPICFYILKMFLKKFEIFLFYL
jgi:hypothetical protein